MIGKRQLVIGKNVQLWLGKQVTKGSKRLPGFPQCTIGKSNTNQLAAENQLAI